MIQQERDAWGDTLDRLTGKTKREEEEKEEEEEAIMSSLVKYEKKNKLKHFAEPLEKIDDFKQTTIKHLKKKYYKTKDWLMRREKRRYSRWDRFGLFFFGWAIMSFAGTCLGNTGDLLTTCYVRRYALSVPGIIMVSLGILFVLCGTLEKKK